MPCSGMTVKYVYARRGGTFRWGVTLLLGCDQLLSVADFRAWPRRGESLRFAGVASPRKKGFLYLRLGSRQHVTKGFPEAGGLGALLPAYRLLHPIASPSAVMQLAGGGPVWGCAASAGVEQVFGVKPHHMEGGIEKEPVDAPMFVGNKRELVCTFVGCVGKLLAATMLYIHKVDT